MEYQQEMGHFAIDAGADMVIGHHSHQPQPMEVYQGKPILYSLANFVHDLEGFRGRTLMAILVRCLISDGKSSGCPMSPASFGDRGRRTLPGPRRCRRLSNA